MAKVGLAKVGQIRMAKVGLAKVGLSRVFTGCFFFFSQGVFCFSEGFFFSQRGCFVFQGCFFFFFQRVFFFLQRRCFFFFSEVFFFFSEVFFFFRGGGLLFSEGVVFFFQRIWTSAGPSPSARPPKNRVFSLSRHNLHSFFPLSGGPFVEFWWCFKGRGPEIFKFGILGLSSEAPAAPKQPPPGTYLDRLTRTSTRTNPTLTGPHPERQDGQNPLPTLRTKSGQTWFGQSRCWPNLLLAKLGAAGVSHDSPRAQTRTFQGCGVQKHHRKDPPEKKE